MALVTILTPTYNRSFLLNRLFQSLQVQTNMDFEWLIVDDGSTDDTSRRVGEFKCQSRFLINYLRKENGGKHTAINYGLPYVRTELVFIVDSDDFLTEDAINVISAYYRKYRHDVSVGVWSFLRENIHHGILVKMQQDEFVGSYVCDRIRKSVPGDMAEVYLTDALKEFPFPAFEGEKFLSEDVVWIPLGLKYRTVFINRAIYQFAYLSDGLTNNDKRHKFSSPLGSMMRGKALLNKECGFMANIRGAIIYGVYCQMRYVDLPDIVRLESFAHRFLVSLLYPISLLYRWKWRRAAQIKG